MLWNNISLIVEPIKLWDNLPHYLNDNNIFENHINNFFIWNNNRSLTV